ncbi:MAG: EAL domain-containing protein [Spirochaetaceae bacterium]|nr:EAL domain-containing protein [Spirochaetaceae bacterium]
MQDKLLKRLNLETKLNEAMLNGSFKLYYQPQVDITTNKLRGFEALLRWYDDEIGWISPDQFIPLAEESRLVIPLGDWVMDTACATLRNWIDTYNFEGIMSINVSPIQLKKPSFIYDLDETIKKYSLDPRKIEIEVTEGVLIENMEETVRLLQDVKNLGVGISLDDFGTGYSSLSYLQILPLTTLKIDKSFIANITSKNSVEAEITDSIISLVTKMGLDTIAEGVENAEQLGVLQQINCRNTQGFLMGKPMPVDICEKMLSGDESAILRIENGQDPIRYSI